jgi:hypothetical protein
MRRRGIAITYVVFDLLHLDGRDLTSATYSERRRQLESLKLDGTYWQTPQTFDDGHALFEAVCAHELEGVVAKRKTSRYRPGDRGWSRSRTGSTGATSLSSAINSRRERVFGLRGRSCWRCLVAADSN